MAKTMKAVDAVMVGMGWSGSIMARELTKAGLTVVGLERGADRSPREDFALPRIRDELKYRLRYELMLDTAVETHTFRNIHRSSRCRCGAGTCRRSATASAAPARTGTASPGASLRANSCCAPISRRATAERDPRGDDDPGLGRHL